MNRIAYLSLALLLIISFSACKKNSPSPQNAIVGSWTLHKDIVTYYQNGIKTNDSTMTAADTLTGSIQFNKDGSFSSKAFYFTRTINIADPPTAESIQDTGKYTVSGMSLKLSLMPADFSFGAFAAVWGVWGSVTISNQIYSCKLNALDQHNLNIENQQSYTVTDDKGVSTDYKTVSDCHYTR